MGQLSSRGLFLHIGESDDFGSALGTTKRSSILPMPTSHIGVTPKLGRSPVLSWGLTTPMPDSWPRLSTTSEARTTWGSQGDGDGQFAVPEGIAVDGEGKVYVADAFNNRVQVFRASGEFLAKWGSECDGDGQFFQPRGIAVDREGNVYVADTNNNRVQVFSVELPAP